MAVLNRSSDLCIPLFVSLLFRLIFPFVCLFHSLLLLPLPSRGLRLMKGPLCLSDPLHPAVVVDLVMAGLAFLVSFL